MIVGDDPAIATLKQAAGILGEVAAREELFPLSDFPATAPDDAGKANRYLISKQPDDSFALYLNTVRPGRSNNPHNHTTWAVLVAIEGMQENRSYRVIDRTQGRAQLELVATQEISSGNPAVLLQDDIHSVHCIGDALVRQFNLYGRALETLTDRVGYDLKTGEVVNYNRTHMVATVEN
ncbi:MAG: cysteine dioxygenase [Alphaproteobacteria bacterium]|nr:cysteine dioxygenase [Alphaproteobacteria bacterium]